MRAILIDPYTCTVSEVEHNGDFKHIYELIGCDCFTIVTIDRKGTSCFVDDNGLIEDIESKQFFSMPYYNGRGAHILAGKGLILGTDVEGASVSTDLSVADTSRIVAWVPQQWALEHYALMGY